MTDKERILKVIKQKQQDVWPTDTGKMAPATVPNNLELGWLNALKWMERYINSLPAEQPSEDLEEEIKRKYKSNNALMMPIEDFRKLIHHFTDWQKEQMMKSAVNGVMDCDDSNEWVEITDRFVVTPSRSGKKEKAILFMEDEQLNNKVNVEPPSFEESQGEFNSYNVALNG